MSIPIHHLPYRTLPNMTETDLMPGPDLYRTDYHRQNDDNDPWHYVQGCGCECCTAWEDWVSGLDLIEQGPQLDEAQVWEYHRTGDDSNAG